MQANNDKYNKQIAFESHNSTTEYNFFVFFFFFFGRISRANPTSTKKPFTQLFILNVHSS